MPRWKHKPRKRRRSTLSKRGKRCTYIIEAMGSGYVKIGVTGDLKRRFQSLSNGSPVKLAILRTIDDPKAERILHRLMAEHRSHGEWFHFNEESCGVLNGYLRDDPDFVYVWPGMSEWS